ncbi:glycogen debranching N-terminal domain-containing protein [Micromonospora krabiensis]|uniref:Glycogen debranching enzyme (Alpha-1,6-glucosidase) n=1 Tax=Micromonospora krabiensis TaxID=307121 RepID=A0A1C3MXS7_9ACTN|nr:glycogen debranching N-terminal domain-containing protein [Micromonospora krabiensis]SBV25140.1 Glycogen debranching enzyme (alpha-1,6-glucosidase) [Micromonospora krabiensis]
MQSRSTPSGTRSGTQSDTTTPGANREMPPELGSDAVGVFEGRTFMLSNAAGDVLTDSIGGLVHDDTRYLSRWELTIEGSAPLVLSASAVDAYSAAFFLANAETDGLAANRVGVRRERFVGDGMCERVEVEYFGVEPVSVRLRLTVGADFADLFEIKRAGRSRMPDIERAHRADGSALRFSYRNSHWSAVTTVVPEPRADRVEGDSLVWDLHLGRGETWSCDLRVLLNCQGEDYRPVSRTFGEEHDPGEDDAAWRWRANKPYLSAESELLSRVYHKSAVDLVSMRIVKEIRGERVVLLAAGMPWFLTIFGRDTLITAYQSITCGPDVARGALLTLAKHQGTRVDHFSDEEPGKILHEYRSGELTQLGVVPYGPCFGAADTTQLWLVLLSEYWRWTGDDDLVQRLRPHADAALRWIDEFGDRDGDGYVEYATHSPEGMRNQCWRDSPDGVQFADSSLPALPIATCEIQGYTYDAKVRAAELADGPWADGALARRLRADAADLRDRFNRDFWLPGRGGYYAVGLDADKRPIDSMTSNMGHLLWSGIVPPDRATQVARHLVSDAMFSGWGIRTLSREDVGYNPIGYHLGTVWPHDNSIIAAGLARYGYHEEANRVAMAMLEAAAHFEYRLPEALSGYDRSLGRRPVPYPTACNPQAWASGAPLLFLRTMLGLDVSNGSLAADPHVPEALGHIRLSGITARGQRHTVEAGGSRP